MEPNVEKIAQVIGEVKKVIVGKNESIYKVMMAILAGGHVLLEDVPGVGKTRMALSFSKAMMLKANRIQFTPDVLPADITGFSMYQKHTGNFVYQPGAAMCNLLLADEINRTSPKTQSALLEVMEEGHVTVDGITRPVPQPFIVLATQNPVGFSGTQQLPESQVDRFMISLSIGYPKPEDELRLMKDRHTRDPLDLVEAVMTQEELLYLRKQVENVFIHDIVYEYIIRLANATRNHPMLELGVSPRGALDLMRLAKAAAFLRNRDFALPQDVADVAADAMTHRLRLNTRSRIGHHTTSEVMGLILEQIKMPAPEGVQ